MANNSQHARLTSWRQQARTIGIPEMRRFAEGLGQDWDAVKAAQLTVLQQRYDRGSLRPIEDAQATDLWQGGLDAAACSVPIRSNYPGKQ